MYSETILTTKFGTEQKREIDLIKSLFNKHLQSV